MLSKLTWRLEWHSYSSSRACNVPIHIGDGLHWYLVRVAFSYSRGLVVTQGISKGDVCGKRSSREHASGHMHLRVPTEVWLKLSGFWWYVDVKNR